MTRILHVIPELTGGGAERQLSLLAPAQQALGHDVHIAVLRGEVPALVANAAVPVHVLPVSSNVDPRMIWRYRSLMRDVRADIVQTWMTMPDVTAGAAAFMANIPWVLSERSMARQYPPNWKNNARAYMGKNTSAIIANSLGGVEYWLSKGIPGSRITEIPNAVDVASFNTTIDPPLPAEWNGRPLVMFAGRLSEEKNPVVMIEALARALRGTNAVVAICGAGPLHDDLTGQIAALRAGEFISLLGARRDVFALLRHADLCVAISRHEGSPNVALEAIAAGCPLVVSEIPAYRQLLNDESARFVPVDDIDAIARGIREMLDHPDRARQQAQTASSQSHTLSPADVAKAHDEVYRRILTDRRR